jgi:uncharacterized protein YndB with AHSA1/START domain
VTEPGNFGERRVVISRDFDAPRALVWQAWTDPAMMKEWFGPRGFTVPECRIDLRVGGELYLVMRGADGTDYPMKGVFRDIVQFERLVFSAIAIDKDGNHLLEGETAVNFTEHEQRTTMTVEAHMVGKVAQAPQMLAGMEAGWTQSIDKLEDVVARW